MNVFSLPDICTSLYVWFSVHDHTHTQSSHNPLHFACVHSVSSDRMIDRETPQFHLKPPPSIFQRFCWGGRLGLARMVASIIWSRSKAICIQTKPRKSNLLWGHHINLGVCDPWQCTAGQNLPDCRILFHFLKNIELRCVVHYSFWAMMLSQVFTQTCIWTPTHIKDFNMYPS